MSLLLALARLIDAINEKIGLAVSWALLLALIWAGSEKWELFMSASSGNGQGIRR